MDLGIQLSLHQNCHHQIVFAKVNLKAHYSPSYECEVCHFKKATTDLSREPVMGFFETGLLSTLTNNKFYLFNDSNMYIMIIYINNLIKNEIEALKDLSLTNDIIITKADKGGAVVVIDIDSYINEAN